MEFKTVWKEGMLFKTKIGSHIVSMDAKAPLGREKGASPREILAGTLASSTGMDVMGLLRKYKQIVDEFEIEINTTENHEYPIVFTAIELTYKLHGDIEDALAREAIHLAHTRYSGVCAMLSSSVKITWRLVLNDHVQGSSVNEYLSLE